MIASLTLATPVPPLERTGTESLFKRLDRDGNGRLTVSDGAAVVVSLSPQAIVRFAKAANQGNQAAAESGERYGGGEEARQAGQTGQAGQLTAQRGPAPGAPAKAGPPPAGAAGAGAGAGKPAASNGVKTIQAADANQDSKVTAKEQQAYDARQAARLLALLAEAQPKRGAQQTQAARYQAVQALAA